MNEELREQSDLADDVTQDLPPTHSTVVGRTDFKPWHRTRKHYVREHQWNKALLRLIKQLRRKPEMPPAALDGPDLSEASMTAAAIATTAGRRIRCFTLPGEDLLDLRSAWHPITSEGCRMQFLGFDSGLQAAPGNTNSRVGEAALNMRDGVDKDSTVKAYRFQDIANANSKAWAEFRRYGPYDWINLDLCDSVVPVAKDNVTSDIFSALTQMLRFQMQYQTNPWVFCMTTQVDITSADHSGMHKLLIPTIQNMRQNEDFANTVKQRLPFVEFQNEFTCDLSKLTADQLVDNFALMFGKWLCSVLYTGSPRCAVHLLDSVKYVIDDDQAVNILSLVFWMTPLIAPPVDSTGLAASPAAAKPMPSEVELAMRLLDATKVTKDVDTLLRDDKALHETLCKSQVEMLAGSGYDREEYLRWLKQEEDAGLLSEG